MDKSISPQRRTRTALDGHMTAVPPSHLLIAAIMAFGGIAALTLFLANRTARRIRDELKRSECRLRKTIEASGTKGMEPARSRTPLEKSGNKELKASSKYLAARLVERAADPAPGRADAEPLQQSPARMRAIKVEGLFSGISHQRVEMGVINPDMGQPNQVDMFYVCAIARHTGARRIFEF